MTDAYDDGRIVCGPDRLEIHSYYFPFGTKSVPYTHIGLKELLLGTTPDAPERARQLRAQPHPLAAQLIERGQAAGVVRADCETQDFGLLQTMVGAVMDAAEEVDPDLWRRYFTITLQGLRPQGAALEPLAVPPLPPQRMEELLVGQWKQRRRSRRDCSAHPPHQARVRVPEQLQPSATAITRSSHGHASGR